MTEHHPDRVAVSHVSMDAIPQQDDDSIWYRIFSPNGRELATVGTPEEWGISTPVPPVVEPCAALVTVVARPNRDDRYDVRSPTGALITTSSAEEMHRMGLPVPGPSRVGPLGLTEADTRSLSRPSDWRPSGDWGRAHEVVIQACRETVQKWDKGAS